MKEIKEYEKSKEFYDSIRRNNTNLDDFNVQFELNGLLTVGQYQINENLGITKTYNSENRNKLWDNPSTKERYKDKCFNGKKIYKDKITGNELHRDSNAAKRKYHMKNKKGESISTEWANHAPETDHIVSLKQLHTRNKHNAFLSDAELKSVANNDSNYRIVSKRFNASKGEKSDFLIAISNKDLDAKQKVLLVKEKCEAELYVNSNIAMISAKNASKEFYKGASDALSDAAIYLAVDAATQIMKLDKGETDLKEAMGVIGKEAGKVALNGGTSRVVFNVVSNELVNVNCAEFLQVMNTDAAAIVIGISLTIRNSAQRYMNGEITKEQFYSEVNDNSKIVVAGIVGREVGAVAGIALGAFVGNLFFPIIGGELGASIGEPVGKAVGSLIATVTTAMMIQNKRNRELSEKYINLINSQIDETINNLAVINNNLKKMSNDKIQLQNNTIENGFKYILNGVLSNNYDAIDLGVSGILSVYNQELLFKSQEEFDDFFFSDKKIAL